MLFYQWFGSNMSKISVQSVFSRHNRRKLDELPYQVLQLKGRILEEFVLNFEWVYEKLCGSDTYQVRNVLRRNFPSKSGNSVNSRVCFTMFGSTGTLKIYLTLLILPFF